MPLYPPGSRPTPPLPPHESPSTRGVSTTPEVSQDTWVELDRGGYPDPGALATQVLDSGAIITPDTSPELRAFLEGSRARNTRRAYEYGWRSWQGWCLRERVSPLPAPPREIARFLHSVSKAPRWSLSKVECVISAITHAHRLRGYDPPPTHHTIVRLAISAVRRVKGRAPKAPKTPAAGDEIRSMVSHLDRSTLAGKRDAALLLVGWWSAMRRSELVAITVEDVKQVPDGIAMTIQRSKTDQEGEGATIGLERKGGELCPVEALAVWLHESEVKTGPIFRGVTRWGGIHPSALSAQEVAKLVKRLASAAGLDPKHFGGHSLRAGHVTEAYRQDVPEAQIMETTRHKSATMLRRYRREANPVKRGSSSKIKL